jgi:outer membrane protein TolC
MKPHPKSHSKGEGLSIRLIFLILVAVIASGFRDVSAQQTLTLEQCYELARQNYPLIKQKELYAMSKDFSIANAHSGYMPQVAIYGQATYQSDVTKVTIDNPLFPKINPLSKDQYKVYAEVNQNLYDGGAIKRTSALHETNALINDQQLEVELYKIKDRINQIYFGVLLLDQQLLQVELLKKDILSSGAKVKASIENGTAFRMNADILEAESLKTDQRAIEIKASRRAFLAMLSLFVKQDLPESTTLVEPKNVDLSPAEDITRPELSLFNYQRQLARSQFELTSTRNMPRAGLFVQGGYGKPGLNMLKNEFSTYYIGGLKLSWNLFGLYNANREKQLLDVNTRLVDVQQETFTFNTKLSLRQSSSEVTKLQELIKIDEQLIGLRAKIKQTAKAQLDNGVISANDFLRELNAEDQVKQNQLLHKTQLVMTIYSYNTTSGK